MNSLIVFIILSVQKQTPFTIYNASAGSGKTYTLVQDYLKILFSSNSVLAFRTILALTFTNKAVGEMKDRIIETLKVFSNPTVLGESNSMFEAIASDLNIKRERLHERSKILLHNIVHNYAAFDISTIDKFNHRLIRTFAHDLKLPVNFEVELDTKTLLARAVDKLIDKAGDDKELTKLLVDFAIHKVDDDKSWDISHDLYTISELLINENDTPYINQLEHKTLQDFQALKSNLQKQITQTSNQISEVAKTVLDLIQQSHLSHSDFSASYLPKHFTKLAIGNFNVSFFTKWQDDLLEGSPIYPKKVSEDVSSVIDGIRTQLSDAFSKTRTAVFQVRFLKNAYNNITPLSVLTAIKSSLDALKNEDNLLLISEFNSIINKEIKEQPTSFIYERIGEKFKHYFIDEFQDTSVLQWENLIPLIENAITGENLKGQVGTAMLVGDAKQAIYRWRGGRPEQFIDLYSGTNPFHVDKTVKNLPSNYRSYKHIINFNNAFFDHVADVALHDPLHKTLFKSAKQKTVFEEEGYVELNFLNLEEDDKDELYCEAVLNSIKKALDNGFCLRDICIIVRRRKEGVTIAEYLSSKQLAIISSETLLLKNAPEIIFLINIMLLASQPNNEEVKIQVLNFLIEQRLPLNDSHDFLSRMIRKKVNGFFKSLKPYDYDFDFEKFLQLPLYEGVESIIRAFKLNKDSNAYLQFFLDEVLDYSLKYNSSLSEFIDYWNQKKDTLSIVSPQGKDAIQIMTIHKSKGLEFPVVIFPYANQDLYFNLNSRIWFPVDSDSFNGFSHLYLNVNKDLEHYNELSSLLYNEYRSKLELDSFNLLYVVLTRAVEQLYIISEFDVDKKQSEKLNFYSGLFINYLKRINFWKDNTYTYSFGHPKKNSTKTTHPFDVTYIQKFISTAKETHQLNIVTSSGYLWDTEQEKAIEKGNLIHNILSEIKTSQDVAFVLSNFKSLGKINSKQLELIDGVVKAIVNHEQLQDYFKPDMIVYNEHDILCDNNQILRPDRVVINSKNEAVIIDYKTGIMKSNHELQLNEYQSVLETMNYKVVKKILVYINETITIKEF